MSRAPEVGAALAAAAAADTPIYVLYPAPGAETLYDDDDADRGGGGAESRKGACGHNRRFGSSM